MGYHNNDKDNSLDKVLKLLRLSDEALHQYDQKYRMMAENSNDIISLHRPADLTFLYTNSTIQRILGYYPREMIGKSALDFIHPEDHKTFLNSIKKARKIGEGAIQYRCRKKDGSYIWLESNGKTIQDEAGTRASLINTRDISERKHFERQIQYRLSLEEAVAKSARLFFTEKSPPLSEILKTLGEAVYVNRAYIFEFDENGITMSNTYEWCDSETKAQAQDLQGMEASLFSWWMSKLNQGENVIIPDISLLPPEAEAEKNLLEPQGIHSLAVVPICLANSRLVGFMGFDDIKKCREWRNEDIATLRVVAEMIGLYWERRNVENALRNSEKQMSAIIDFLPDATFVIDKQGKVITWNRAMEEMTGIKSEDILGKANYEYSLPFFGKRIPALIDMVLNPESKSLVAYLSIIEKDGVLVGEAFCPQIKLFLSGTASALYDAQGNKIGAIESLRNITERWQAEEKIKFLSFHDKLTGLYNRAFFEEEIRRLDTERNLPLSIIIGDVNGLKFVNDVFGHGEGDRLLLKVAEILTNACRKEDIIARWGGDEFAILLPKANKEIAGTICKRITEACNNTEIDPIQVSIALGTGCKKTPEENIFSILQTTDDNMYRNKLWDSKSKRNCFIDVFEQTFCKSKYEDEHHSGRLRELVEKSSSAFSLSSDEIDALALLCTMHDIGKISIPKDILNKPYPLSEEEWEIVKKHSESGYRIAQSTPEIASIAEAVLTHHEHWDGSGYPLGLNGEKIPRIARIFAIIDAYDIMTHGSSYKEAISEEKAWQEISNCAGSQFDPHLVKTFLDLVART